MIQKQPNGKWLADIRPNGRDGKRYRKQFKTKGEAERWAAWLTTGKTKDKEWEPKTKDRRTLRELVESWYTLHGHHLKDGKPRRRKLLAFTDIVGNPRAVDFTAAHFTRYRADRIASGTHPNTLNHEHAYLRAVFNELIRLEEWNGPNPVAKVRQLKTDQTELHYLDDGQIITLLETLDTGGYSDAPWVTRVCLSTGARWTEAETLRREQVRGAAITFTSTKNGKNRTIPIPECLSAHIAAREAGRLFLPSYDAFRRAVDDSGLELPEGQLTHVLRHTFASHFIQRGGNILTLQRILDHSTLAMTMRYAHLAPDHFEAARNLNPLA